MLGHCSAASYHNYLKYGYKYQQDMLKLPSDKPSVYELFQKGQFVVRRSDRFWAGIGSDLVIEQELMCSIKIWDGLTRGSGLTEIQQAIWLNSMPVFVFTTSQCKITPGFRFKLENSRKKLGRAGDPEISVTSKKLWNA
ncbi:hypothetical protein PR048_008708 [Dryococelus australis]|uniref:Uncharacterized protein n=1 Tax=Dryococelus australis TaxID=614101 RepID=A0ABQ9HYW7_9NEOP|nr:hypothetical protein PR048_008708 [Dryococelus australis]